MADDFFSYMKEQQNLQRSVLNRISAAYANTEQPSSMECKYIYKQMRIIQNSVFNPTSAIEITRSWDSLEQYIYGNIVHYKVLDYDKGEYNGIVNALNMIIQEEPRVLSQLCSLAVESASNDDLALACAAVRLLFNRCDICTSKSDKNKVQIEEGKLIECFVSNFIYVIPEAVTEIGASAFNGSKDLQTIIVPNTVKTIDKRSFCEVPSLNELIFMNSADSYGEFVIDHPFDITSERIENMAAVETENTEKQEQYSADTSTNTSTDASADASTTNTKSKGGCYIATAVYGSYNCPPVWALRRYRDNKLALSFPGRFFVRLYYSVSPVMVRYFGGNERLKHICKRKLDVFVALLVKKGYESTPYMDK